MRVYAPHHWDLDYRQAVALQHQLSGRVKLQPLPLGDLRYVAGADMAISKRHGKLFAAVVVMAFPSLDIVETRTAAVALTFPYIPGLLSFREIPGLIRCFAKVETPVDAIICDGQGIAHPRGIGLASHLGLLLRRPTIGCAKSLLVGEHGELGYQKGAFSPLIYKGKRVGSVLRSRSGVRPLYVSPGHLVDQASSRRIVLACAPQYRLPEPTRQADRLAGELKRQYHGERSLTEKVP
jgi:deoxyribonuclease V